MIRSAAIEGVDINLAGTSGTVLCLDIAVVTGENPPIDNADATHFTSFSGVANGVCAKP